MHKESLEDTTTNKEKENLLFKMIERFRNHVRLRDAKSLTASHSAFATDSENKPDSKGPSLKGKPKEIPECLCGSKHYWGQCDYIRSDRPGRPGNFKPDPATQRKVEERLKDAATKSRVDKSIERLRTKEKEKQASPSETPKPPRPYMGAFAVLSVSNEA